MATITTKQDTTANKDLLRGGLRKIFDNTTGEETVLYPKLVNDLTTDMETERDLRHAGLTTPTEIAEGQRLTFQKPDLGIIKEYSQKVYGTGFRMTFKMNYFNKYGLWARYTKQLAKVMKAGKDIEVHVMFNNLTSTSLGCGVGFDALAIANDTHTGLPNVTAGQYDNYLNSALAHSSLASARYYFATLKNDKGMWMGAKPDTLVFEPTLWPTVMELFGSDNIAHQLSNTKNVFKNWITPFEDARLTSATCWLVLAKKDSNYDFNVFTSMNSKFYVTDQNLADDTLDKKAFAIQMFAYGWGDPRLLYAGKA